MKILVGACWVITKNYGGYRSIPSIAVLVGAFSANFLWDQIKKDWGFINPHMDIDVAGASLKMAKKITLPLTSLEVCLEGLGAVRSVPGTSRMWQVDFIQKEAVTQNVSNVKWVSLYEACHFFRKCIKTMHNTS